MKYRVEKMLTEYNGMRPEVLWAIVNVKTGEAVQVYARKKDAVAALKESAK